MDILTHAMMGLVAGTAIPENPLASVVFVAGSVAPDLDAFSRVFGKRAFLRFHQTWSHSLFAVIGSVLILWPIFYSFELLAEQAFDLSLAFGIGMLFHVLLDISNTYGIAFFLPFSRRRICLEWVFFIDLFVVVVCVLSLLMIWRLDPARHQMVGIGFCVFVGVYWAAKGWLHRRAASAVPPAISASFMPTTFLPWRYLACIEQQGSIEQFDVNAITQSATTVHRHRVVDDQFYKVCPAAQTDADLQTMKALSAFYHVVKLESLEDDLTKVSWKDFRTRNFNTTFGELIFWVDDSGAIIGKEFHV